MIHHFGELNNPEIRPIRTREERAGSGALVPIVEIGTDPLLARDFSVPLRKRLGAS